jgi:catechol 2,3-dioxygenase-like lactoylglutathione lyase family enzyme
MSVFTKRAAAVALGVLLMTGGGALLGQAPAAGAGAIIGTGMFTPMVENMDRSLAFYHDVFDMEVPPLPDSGARPYNNPNPRLFKMFDIAGARERHQAARVPGISTGVEPMEIQDIDHRTVRLRISDPGVATLVLIVRDIESTLTRLSQANVRIVTPGGQPVMLADGSRALLIRDVDERFIEIRQPASLPETAVPDASNVVDIRLSITVNDMDRTKAVYRDVLGFKLEGETEMAADDATRALTGLSAAKVRRARVQARGSALWIEFVEFGDVARVPLRMRIQDRGAARLQLRTENIDAMVNAVKGAGLAVVTQGGAAVPIPPDFRGVLVADPNNFFVSLFEPCNGCAPRTPALVQ